MTDEISVTWAEVTHRGRHLFEPALTELHREIRQDVGNLIVFAPMPKQQVQHKVGSENLLKNSKV